MSQPSWAFRYRLRVRWAEVDLQRVVFFGHYATYCDLAFTEFMRAIGLPDPIAQQHAGRELFMRKTEVEYLAPARYDDWLDVALAVVHIGRSSLSLRFAIERDGVLLSRAAFVYVYAEPTTGRSVPIPEDWRHKLSAAHPSS